MIKEKIAEKPLSEKILESGYVSRYSSVYEDVAEAVKRLKESTSNKYNEIEEMVSDGFNLVNEERIAGFLEALDFVQKEIDEIFGEFEAVGA